MTIWISKAPLKTGARENYGALPQSRSCCGSRPALRRAICRGRLLRRLNNHNGGPNRPFARKCCCTQATAKTIPNIGTYGQSCKIRDMRRRMRRLPRSCSERPATFARMLLPSLYGLDSDGLLPADLRIIGTARTPLDDAGFRSRAEEALKEHLPAASIRRASPSGSWRGCVMCRSTSPTLGASSGWPKPSAILATASRSSFRRRRRCSSRPSTGSRRPGSLARQCAWRSRSRSVPTSNSSREINDAVAAAFPEDRMFRIDHYLGKETVQNLLALRFANLMFEPLWNWAHIDHVQITVAETIGVEGRGEYYDSAGALRDMVQNHMLQLLALVAMEPPTDFDATAVRDEKVKVLRALRPFTASEAETNTVTGQYTRGAIDGEPSPATTKRSATRAAPRRSSRSRPMSTTGGGRAFLSTCAPASACPSATPRSSSSSRTCLIRSSRRAARRPSPTS